MPSDFDKRKAKSICLSMSQLIMYDANENQPGDTDASGVEDDYCYDSLTWEKSCNPFNCEELLAQLKHNDPGCTSLHMMFGYSLTSDYRGYHAHSVDWAKEGDCISLNAHLRSLLVTSGKIVRDDIGSFLSNIWAFFEAVAANRSIKYLMIGAQRLDAEEIFTILTPFLEQNTNLRMFHVHNCNIGNEEFHTITSAISNCNKDSLRRFGLSCSSWQRDDSVANLIDKLATHNKLDELDLYFENVKSTVSSGRSKKYCISMGNLLKKPGKGMKELNLNYHDLEDADLAVLAEGLMHNKAIKKLCLACIGRITIGDHKSSDTPIGWGSLIRSLLKSSIEVLDLSSNIFGGEDLISLANALATCKNVREIYLDNLQSDGKTAIPAAAWQTFFVTTKKSSKSWEKLKLGSNTLDDDAVISFVDSLTQSSRLKSLNLSHSSFITSRGWESIPDLLRNPQSRLEQLDLYHTTDHKFTDEVMIRFANALSENNTLKKLLSNNSALSRRSWDALSCMLCNNTTIESIYASNHTLERVSLPAENTPTHHVATQLELNQGKDKAAVARKKILMYHFGNGTKNIEEFAGMDTKLIPRAISWICRDHDGLLLLYQLARTMPSWLEGCNGANTTSAKKQKCF